jgi:hypothetical protein
MKLVCEGYGAVGERETGGAVRVAMLARGEEAHSNLFDGEGSDEIQMMIGTHVRKGIADPN